MVPWVKKEKRSYEGRSGNRSFRVLGHTRTAKKGNFLVSRVFDEAVFGGPFIFFLA